MCVGGETVKHSVLSSYTLWEESGNLYFIFPEMKFLFINILKDIVQWLLDSSVLTLGGCYYEQSFVAIVKMH